MKTCGEEWRYSSTFPDLGTRRTWVVSSGREAHRTYCIGGWLDPTHRRDELSVPGIEICSVVAIPTELSTLLYVDESYLWRSVRDSAPSIDRNSLSRTLFLFLFWGSKYCGRRIATALLRMPNAQLENIERAKGRGRRLETVWPINCQPHMVWRRQ
jgi:hypothetical protein